MHAVVTSRATQVRASGIRPEFFDDLWDYCLDSPSSFPSGSARDPYANEKGFSCTYDTGHCGSRECPSRCFSVSPDIGDVVHAPAALPCVLPSQGVDKAGFLDGVSDRPFEQVVGNVQPDHCDDGAGQDRDNNFFAVCGGQCDFHGSSSGCIQSDAKRFCPPPPVNAAGLLDGSPKAGEGADTPVAALFVRRKSHYKGLAGVDCFDEDRNALTWRGGCPVVAHPPCRSWGRYKAVAKPRPGERELAIWAVAMVRRFGGVVEHPWSSGLWHAIDACAPGVRDQYGGVLIPVYQCWWGHRAEKHTGLYIVGRDVPSLPELAIFGAVPVESMCRAERERTTAPFASWLVDLARGCVVGASA